MRKLLYLITIILFASVALGANIYIGDLTENTSPDPTDYMEIDDGTNSEKAQLGNVITRSHGLSDGFPKITSGIMSSVSDIDPDDLLGDTTDDNKIDAAVFNLAGLKSSLSVDDLITLSGRAEGSTHLGTFTGGIITDNITIKAALQELETEVEGLGGGHDPITLSTDLNSNLLGLSTQQLTLDSQSQNYVFAGPTSGSGAPTFRLLVAADIPDISATYEVQLNNEAGLYAVLSDVSDFMQPGDTVQTAASTSLPGSCTVGQLYIDTDQDTDGEMYMCVATDTWKAVDNEGGSGDDEKVKVSSNETDADYLVNQITSPNGEINIAESGSGAEDLQLTIDVDPSVGFDTLEISDDGLQVKYKAADFDETDADGLTIDYTNGQAASGSTKGFLTSTDWTTFNNKEDETHAGEHAVGGADAVFPNDPDSNAIYTWDDTAGVAEWGTATTDLTYNGSNWFVVDDSHNHVYYNIDAFSEAQLYSILNDVTQFYEPDDAIATPQITFADNDVSPNAVGEFNYDNNITNLDDGGFVWYDDDEVQLVISMPVANFAAASDDDCVMYDAVNDEHYFGACGGGGGATAWSSIGDAETDETIQFLGYEQLITTTIDESGGVALTIKHTDSDGLTNDTYLMEFIHSNDGDAQAHFIRGLDNDSDELWKIAYDGTFYAKAYETTGATSTPGFTFKDADNPGSDKEIAKLLGNCDTGNSTDGNEFGQMTAQVMIAGTERTFLHYDAYTEALTLGVDETGEDLVFDFATGTANEVSVSSNSGVTEVDFGTIDLVTDKVTVGGTVLTDATLTDDGTLSIVPTIALQVKGSGIVRAGENDTTRGEFTAYGSSATQGGHAFLFVGANYDNPGTFDYYAIDVYEDDLLIGPENDTDALKYDYGNTRWEFTSEVELPNNTVDDADLNTTDVIEIVVDGGGSAITTGVKGYIEIPFACTITQVTMLADTSTTTTVDIWKDSYANYPPDNSDTITGGNEPAISAGVKDQDSTLTSWTTSITAGDILGYNVDANDNATLLTISLRVTR
jgi:hypothetical protein